MLLYNHFVPMVCPYLYHYKVFCDMKHSEAQHVQRRDMATG